MNRYGKWFETQPTFRRLKLLDKKPALKDRIATVKAFLAKQGPAKDLHLDDRNRRALAKWLDRYIADNKVRFIENMAQGSHPGIAKLPPDRQQAVLREMLLRRWQAGLPNGQMPMPVAEHEMARLRAALSPDLRSKLEAKKPSDQDRIIAEWLRETASHELNEQLVDFFENSISDAERDRLMSLPGDEMYEGLSKQYRAHVLKQSKSAEPPRRDDQPRRGERPPWRGHHPGSPWGPGARRWPENDDEKASSAGKDSRDEQEKPSAEFLQEKPPLEKHSPDKSPP
jgi:hypothetical protein